MAEDLSEHFVRYETSQRRLLRTCEISWKRLETEAGIFKDGEKVKVKLFEIDQ